MNTGRTYNASGRDDFRLNDIAVNPLFANEDDGQDLSATASQVLEEDDVAESTSPALQMPVSFAPVSQGLQGVDTRTVAAGAPGDLSGDTPAALGDMVDRSAQTSPNECTGTEASPASCSGAEALLSLGNCWCYI
jgi:hypothetical protein